MINKDSIVTAYDEHLTLVEWLQKVETALKDAVLTGVTINKKGNATLSFVFTFEDGTTLETDDLILQQGESVQSATIRDGHLILTLTNGDELDAGNMFNGNVVINGNIETTGAVSAPILTTANDHIEAQKPIITSMEGYRATTKIETGLTYDFAYIGICLNGNKLTFVCSLKVTKTTAETLYGKGICNFIVPSNVGEKIRPIGSYVDQKIIPAFRTAAEYVNIPFRLTKDSNTNFQLSFTPDGLVQNNEYIIRYEVTFLLSDNLVA